MVNHVQDAPANGDCLASRLARAIQVIRAERSKHLARFRANGVQAADKFNGIRDRNGKFGITVSRARAVPDHFGDPKVLPAGHVRRQDGERVGRVIFTSPLSLQGTGGIRGGMGRQFSASAGKSAISARTCPRRSSIRCK